MTGYLLAASPRMSAATGTGESGHQPELDVRHCCLPCVRPRRAPHWARHLLAYLREGPLQLGLGGMQGDICTMKEQHRESNSSIPGRTPCGQETEKVQSISHRLIDRSALPLVIVFDICLQPVKLTVKTAKVDNQDTQVVRTREHPTQIATSSGFRTYRSPAS